MNADAYHDAHHVNWVYDDEAQFDPYLAHHRTIERRNARAHQQSLETGRIQGALFALASVAVFAAIAWAWFA